MQPISGLVITYNEAQNIRACLESLFEVCVEVVVVDSLSTDDTVAIAESLVAKVYRQAFLGYGPQKNFGLQFCQHDWVLALDADERLDSEAVAAIRQLDLGGSQFDAYSFRRRNFLHGRWIRHTSWYPDAVVRLFNQRKVRFSDAACHEKVLSQQACALSAHIIHYPFRDYRHMLHKLDLYSTQYAEAHFGKKRPIRGWEPAAHGSFAFIKEYLLRRGFLEGVDGLTIALLNAMGSYMKYAKLLEKQRIAAGVWR